jgi:3-hydroxyacyl-CoA dehydrogenase
LGTHFFNPPMHMRLFEIIPTKLTLPAVTQLMEELGRDVLGKGIVYANDTPNFIANRIGVYSTCEAIRLMLKYGFNIPLTDQLTGPVIGRPASAVFRTTDMVGLDILVNVAANVADNVEDPAEKAMFELPGFVSELMEKGALGDKSKGGFYKRMPDKSILFWNHESKQYEAFERAVPDVVKEALASANKYASIIDGDRDENRFAWELIKRTLLYSAAKVPEITSDYKMIDKALVWGYNWEKGPFEVWDAIGVFASVKRMKDEGEEVPEWVMERLAEGKPSFYDKDDAGSPYIKLDRESAKTIQENSDAAVLDIGDCVLCLEFRTKGNALSMKVIDMLNAALDRLESRWRGLVIGNKGRFFSGGANLNDILSSIDSKAWDQIDRELRKFQDATSALKYAAKPVVAAPFGMALGGGAEVVLHSLAQAPAVGTYIGLVEAGVGLIPGAGGCKEMLAVAAARSCGASKAELLAAVKPIWRLIATAAVSSNAFDAIEKGFMKPYTRVIMNPDAILDEAKAKVLELSRAGFMPPVPKKMPLLGDYGYAAIINELKTMLSGGFVSEHDALIAEKIAYILTGGDVAPDTMADESYILELEREAFVSLCGEEKTRQRIEHMLKTGKPLRN